MNTSLISTAITEHDSRLIELWLHGRPPETQRAYQHDIEALLASVQKPLQAVTLYDLQAFSDELAHLEVTSKSRVLSAVKSLFTFSYKSGYTPMNVGAALGCQRSEAG